MDFGKELHIITECLFGKELSNAKIFNIENHSRRLKDLKSQVKVRGINSLNDIERVQYLSGKQISSEVILLILIGLAALSISASIYL
jgi:hypothetical protein